MSNVSNDGFSVDWLLTGQGSMLHEAGAGIPRDVATAAGIALAKIYRSSPRDLGDDALAVMFEDFCAGFEDAARGED